MFAWLRLMPMGHFSKSPMMVGRIKYCWENLLIFKSNSWVQENRFLLFWKERKEILCYSTKIWYNLVQSVLSNCNLVHNSPLLDLHWHSLLHGHLWHLEQTNTGGGSFWLNYEWFQFTSLGTKMLFAIKHLGWHRCSSILLDLPCHNSSG